ncbi:MAG: hypothetical protein H7829_12955 [Magnetococcus sp. THC-1_WYH]
MNADLLEERLEEILEAALSSRRTASVPALGIARLALDQQEQLLSWLAVTAGLNPELAFQCALRAPDVLVGAEPEVMARWFRMTLDGFDREGLRGALDYLNGAGRFLKKDGIAHQGIVTLAGERTCLESFVMGLGGRPMALKEGDAPATDSEIIFLPPHIDLFPTLEQNRLLYRSMVALQWAYSRFGSFFVGLGEELAKQGNPDEVAVTYGVLESCRLDLLLTQLLPGLARRGISLWRHAQPWPPAWYAAVADLSRIGAGPQDSLRWVPQLLETPIPAPLAHHGLFLWRNALETQGRRLEREKHLFRQAVGQALQRQPVGVMKGVRADPDRIRIEISEGLVWQMHLDGQRVILPESVDALARSIIQDLGAIPPEYLQPAGLGGYPAAGMARRQGDDAGWQGVHPEEGVMLLDEWDHKRQDYRKDWCVLREIALTRDDSPFVAETFKKYSGLVHHIRRSFEMIRGGDRRVRRQERGDELDWDVLIDAQVAFRQGEEMDSRLYERMDRVDRNVATVILADMSGSTKGWVNDAIRESLILLARALVILDDRFAIYGFTGNTRKQCELYRVKGFADPMDDDAYGRIAALTPKDYTRMGVFIRRASAILKEQAARSRLLITISDGRPEDYDSFQDGYRGPYGMADTRVALAEARRAGIHPFGITVDREAREYLPHLYGPSRFIVIDSARALPRKISDIYRSLTT